MNRPDPAASEVDAGRSGPIGPGAPPRPDVLCVVHRVPYPPDKGDRIRSFHLLKSLSRRAAVHLACLADEPPDGSAAEALGRFCERVAIVRLGPRARWLRALASLAAGRTVTEGAFDAPPLRSLVRRWARETPFRAALASASSMIPYLRIEELRGVPAVVDLVDVDSQKWLDYAGEARGPRAWLYRTEGRRLRRLEWGIPDWARAVTLVSEAEAGLYRRFRAGGGVHSVTNGVDLEYFGPRRQAGERGCVFVGALDYLPNVDGARWLCREVWPEVRRRLPTATLSLVGRRPSPAIRRLADSPGVEVVGQVPDIRPYLARAAVVVVPLRIARGVQNKVLEAMAMGKAVVASPQALEGLRAEPGAHALVASTPGEWADAVAGLLGDEGLRLRLGRGGRHFVERHHHWDRCLEPFDDLLGLSEEAGAAAVGPGPAEAASAWRRPPPVD